MYTIADLQKKLNITRKNLGETIKNIKESNPNFVPRDLGGTMNYFSEEQFKMIKEEIGKVVEYNSFKSFFAHEQEELNKQEQLETEKLHQRFQIQRDKLLDEAAEKWSKANSEMSFTERAKILARELEEMRNGSSRKLSVEKRRSLAKQVEDLLRKNNLKYFTAAEIFEHLPEVKPHWESIKKFMLARSMMLSNDKERNNKGYICMFDG